MKNNKSTDFLKECMADALISLMVDLPFEKISVADIVEYAGVGRSTYFRNFNNKSELITYHLHTNWKKYIDEIRPNSVDYGIVHTPDLFFMFIYKSKETIKLIYKSKQVDTLNTFILQASGYQNVDELSVTDKYTIRCYANAIFGVVDEWAKRQFNESPEFVSSIVIKNLYK